MTSRLIAAFAALVSYAVFLPHAAAQTVFINEIHYDNAGSDAGEGIEIAGPAGTDLSGWQIVLYNGSGGAPYATRNLSVTLADDGSGFGFYAEFIGGIQNGAPDGVALVDGSGTVVQFLSYEGSFTAVGGPADGLTSTDIGVAESSGTPVGFSLHLIGTGTTFTDFAWTAAAESFGAVNVGQSFGGTPPPPPPPPAAAPGTVFINEIHYDNAGGDVGEAIEIAGPAGTDLSGWQLVRYNGSTGASYGTDSLGGTIADDGSGYGFVVQNYPSNGLQNGAPDGVALVDNTGAVVQFLSYEGSFTASGGPADGLTSTDIGVSEPGSTPVGNSLQLEGTGLVAADFTWADVSSANTFGIVNTGQVFGTPPPPDDVFINEIHYDNAGGDVGEAIEIAGPAGRDVTGWQLVRYNGSNGTSYGSDTLAGTIPDDGSGFGFVVQNYPSNGLQNGAPDGVALVDNKGAVIQFLSYEGSFTASGGPADGLTSTDIGVSEPGSTPVGNSLQLTGTGTKAADFTWAMDSQPNTFGAVNTGQSFGSAPPPPPPPPPTVGICEIQGAGTASPIVGQEVTVVGIVTGDFQDSVGTSGDLNGFYIEDPGCDTNPATSNGIFVFDGSNPDTDVVAGQEVSVIGRVAEFFGETQINATGSLGMVAISPVPATYLSPTPVSLPSVSTFVSGSNDTIADLEQYEGMLVEFTGYYEVTELFNLDRFGEVILAQGGRFTQYTQANLPDAAGFAAHIENLGSRTLYLDDGLINQNPDPIRYPAPGLDSSNTVRMGDVVTNLVGNLRYSRGSGGSGDEAYRLQPTVEPMFIPSNTREDAPARPNRSLRVVSLNVLNFFTSIDQSGAECFPSFTRSNCRGADSVEEFDRQFEKLITAMSEMDADVFGLVEIENDFMAGPSTAIQTLVDGLNANPDTACDRYAAVMPGIDRVGDDAIAVGMIYCASRVELARWTQPAILDDAELERLAQQNADILAFFERYGLDYLFRIWPRFPTFDGPVFNGPATNRAPLAATFRPLRSFQRFTVVVNHFKSKGSSGLFGQCSADPMSDPNCDMLDGAGFWDERRTDASRALAAWLRTKPTGARFSRTVIVGDLNAYLNEDPILELENSGYVNPLRDDPNAYSFVFDRQIGTLDYAFVDRWLARRILQVSEWHINADEPDALDYNLDFGRNPTLFDGAIPERSSDHDPLIIDFALRGRGFRH